MRKGEKCWKNVLIKYDPLFLPDVFLRLPLWQNYLSFRCKAFHYVKRGGGAKEKRWIFVPSLLQFS